MALRPAVSRMQPFGLCHTGYRSFPQSDAAVMPRRLSRDWISLLSPDGNQEQKSGDRTGVATFIADGTVIDHMGSAAYGSRSWCWAYRSVQWPHSPR